MPRGRRWTDTEDTAIEHATFDNLKLGRSYVRSHRGRGLQSRPLLPAPA